MNTIISLDTAKKLEERGCDVPTQSHHWDTKLEDDAMVRRSDPKFQKLSYLGEKLYPAYDLRDIICDWEMAKKFFGEKHVYCGGYSEPAFMVHTDYLKKYLVKNKKEEAEKYLLKHCVFNRLS